MLLVVDEIKAHELMCAEFQTQVTFPNSSQRCDLLIVDEGASLYVEVKMMRKLRNNGGSEDHATHHILSPYPEDGSALTDIDKLRNSAFEGPKAILIYGFDYDAFPLETVINAFEQLAGSKIQERYAASFAGLVHPYHQRGTVYGWLVDET